MGKVKDTLLWGGRKYSRRVGEGEKIMGKVKDTLLWGVRKRIVIVEIPTD
jgi:hypothetical protein